MPISSLTRDGSVPSDPASLKSVLGIWGGASRRKVQIRDANGTQGSGPWVQVSRLGNPLFNEVIVPVGEKDRWNAVDPIDDVGFEQYVNQPELAKLLPVLYPVGIGQRTHIVLGVIVLGTNAVIYSLLLARLRARHRIARGGV